jgi:Skp family chaperone for outer membrane proteins
VSLNVIRAGRSVGVLLLLAALGAGAAARAAAPVAEKKQRTAVVNVSYLFENYKKVTDVQKRIDGSHEAEKNSLTRRIKELNERNKELREFFNNDTASPAIFDAVQKLRKDTFTYQNDLNKLNAQIQVSYTKEMREVLGDIRVAIRAVAERERFDLVLRSPDTDDPDVKPGANPAADDDKTYLQRSEPQTVAQLVERFNRNPVLFGAKAVDITLDVLKMLNADFEKRSGGR